MELQQISAKIYAQNSTPLSSEVLIPIFHNWIRAGALDKLLIDVVDYSHVPNGPGVMLIAHEGHYGLDLSDGRPGVRWAAKRDPAGPPAQKIAAALSDALRAAQALENDPMTANQIAFDTARILIRVESRLEVENKDDDLARLRPVVEQVLASLYGEAGFELSPLSDPRDPIGFEVRGATAPSYSDSLARLEPHANP